MQGLKDLIRPPFATYDVVVYFGCGVASLPLLSHYIMPQGTSLPRSSFGIGVSWADDAIATLSVLFGIYILGHIYAFLSSLLIEKTADLVFGKMSSASILSRDRQVGDKSFDQIRAWVKDRWKRAWEPGGRSRSSIRAIFLAPVIPAFIFAYVVKWFGHYASRISPDVFARIDEKLCERRLGAASHESGWYKAAEHDVINNDPEAVPRMYNYLVISGLFRTVAFLFALCAWLQLIRLISVVYAGSVTIGDPVSMQILAWVAWNILFAFSFTAYIKFTRRYVEEMLFAFALKNRSPRLR